MLNLLSERSRRRLAVLAANILKRKLDAGTYDKILSAKWGDKLKNLSSLKKHLTELGLGGIGILLDENLSETTSLRKFLNEVLSDIPSEVSKRMFNHRAKSLKATMIPNRDLINSTLKLKKEEIKELVRWFTSTSDEEKTQIKNQVNYLMVEELKKLLSLDEQTRNSLLKITQSTQTRELEPENLNAAINKVNDKLSSIRQSIRSRRQRRKS